MSKETMLNIGLALNSIAMLVSENDLKKIKPYLTKIEEAVLSEDEKIKSYGRLIDAEALFKDIISSFDIKDRNYFLASEQAIVDCIGRAPTVIV